MTSDQEQWLTATELRRDQIHFSESLFSLHYSDGQERKLQITVHSNICGFKFFHPYTFM